MSAKLLMPVCRLIVLALRHFEGTLETDQLISSYLLCKSRWSIRKHLREMSTPKVSADNLIKVTSLWPAHTSGHPTETSLSRPPVTLPDIHHGGFRPAAASFLQLSSTRRAAPPGGSGHCRLTQVAQGELKESSVIHFSL